MLSYHCMIILYNIYIYTPYIKDKYNSNCSSFRPSANNAPAEGAARSALDLDPAKVDPEARRAQRRGNSGCQRPVDSFLYYPPVN